MARIIIGIDGSAASERVLAVGLEEGARHGQPITVVAVHPSPEAAPAWGVPSMRPRAEDVERTRAGAAALVDAAVAAFGQPVEVAVHVQDGVPAEVLTDQVGPDDRIVIGSRGVGGFRRAFLGSVSHDIVHSAPCPVLVVPTHR